MPNWFQRLRQGVFLFFRALFNIVTFPFRLLFNIVAFPFRITKRFLDFLNHDPGDRPFAEALADLAADTDTRAQAWEHFWALRKHLFRSVIALALATFAAFFFTERIMEYLAVPVGGLEKLQAIQVTEEIGVFMRVAMTVGVAAAFPYIALETWWFAAAGGLRPWEKKLGLAGIPIASLLFLLGMAFTFYFLLPAALPFLGSFTSISQFWSAREYFAFITGLMLWIGAFCEFPLVIFLLSYMGYVQPKFLTEHWRVAVIVIAFLAAAVTPTVDPVNMGLVMLPMILLYFVGIGFSHLGIAMRRRKQEIEARLQEPADKVELG